MVSEHLSNHRSRGHGNFLSEVATGVYFRPGDMSRGQSNGGYIVCDDYVVAIEAPSPEASAEMLEEVKKLFDKPIKFLIITHGHWDHDNGVAAFAEKGVTVICSEDLRRRYVENGKVGSYIGITDRLTLQAFDIREHHLLVASPSLV